MAVPSTVAGAIMVLDAHLTQYDQRASKRRGYNPYALGHYLAASKRVGDDLPPGPLTPDGVAILKRSIRRNFHVSDMPPARKTIEDLDKFLVTGELAYPGVKKKATKKKATKKASKKVARRSGPPVVGGVCLTSKVKYWARDDQGGWHIASQATAARIMGSPKGEYQQIPTARGTTDVALLTALPPEYKASDLRGQQIGGATLWDWALGAKTCAQVRTQIDDKIREDVWKVKTYGGFQPRYVGLYIKMRDDLCGGGGSGTVNPLLRTRATPETSVRIVTAAANTKPARKKATKKATKKVATTAKTMAEIRAALKRRVDAGGEAPQYLTDVAALPVFRGVHFGRLQKAAEQLAAKREIRYDGVRTSMVSARVEGVELREIKRDLVGPFTITDEGEENIYFTDGGGKPYFFKHEGSEAQRSGFFKAVKLGKIPNPTDWPEDKVPAKPARKKATKKKATKKKANKKVTKRKTPVKKKPAKRTRTRAEEARAKRLAKKNAVTRRKKVSKKKAPQVQRSPAEERRILNAWKRGAGAV